MVLENKEMTDQLANQNTYNDTKNNTSNLVKTTKRLLFFLCIFLFGVLLGIGIQRSILTEQQEISQMAIENNIITEQKSNNNIKNELIGDLKELKSDILVSDWDTQYAIYLKNKNQPLDYYPYGEEKGGIWISEDLIALNLETGERKLIDISKDLISQDIIAFLENLSPEVHYRLNTVLLGWSPFSENVLWGKILVYSSGDPPIASEVGYFKIDLQNATTEISALPNHGLFGSIFENTNAGKILYESLGDGLSLYEYDLNTKEDKLLVSYGKDVFDKYCSDPVEYVYKTPFYGDCGRDRDLNAVWEPNEVSYFDFVTREKVFVEQNN